MQTNFNTTAPDGITESILLIEWQPLHGTAVWLHQAEKRVLHLHQMRLEKDPSAAMQSMQDWYHQLPEDWKPVQQVVVIYNHPGFTLLPLQHKNTALGEKILELTNADSPRESVQCDTVNGWQVSNFYRLPTEWPAQISKNWNNATVFHFSSLFLETISRNAATAAGLIRIAFFQGFFLVAVCQSDKLLLLQTYEFEKPEDISYYLLSICKQFELDQQQVTLLFSGMIDPDSSLYAELEKYFVNKQGESAGSWSWPQGLLSGLPDHYFSPLFQMAACV